MTFYQQFSEDELPNILIFTGQTLSRAHGTGTSLLRHFRGYPREKLFNVYWSPAGEPELESIHVRWNHDVWKAFSAAKDYRVIDPPKGIRRQIAVAGFRPDVLYSTFFGVFGCKIVHQILEEYEFALPAIQHFMDLSMPDDEIEPLFPALREVEPYIDQFWALTPSLARDMGEAMGREVEIVEMFADDPAPVQKTEHRAASEDFTCVITGNIWNEPLIPELKDAWNYVQSRTGSIQPIQWYGHPSSLTNKIARYELDQPDSPIEYSGFLQRDSLYQTLADADMAIIPFNRFREPESTYAKYSLPSRLTETLLAGTPVFVIAGSDTDTGQYVERHGLGMAASPDEPDVFREKLYEFVVNRELRTEFGNRALQMAENEYSLERYQEFLLGRLRTAVHEADSKPSSDALYLIRTQNVPIEKLKQSINSLDAVRTRQEQTVQRRSLLRDIPLLGKLYILLARVRKLGEVWAYQQQVFNAQAEALEELSHFVYEGRRSLPSRTTASGQALSAIAGVSNKSSLQRVTARGMAVNTILDIGGDNDGAAIAQSIWSAAKRHSVTTSHVDSEVAQNNLPGPYLIWIAGNGADREVMQSASQTLYNTNVILARLMIFGADAERLPHMMQFYEQLGFRCVDVGNMQYRPYDDSLFAVDCVFIRQDRSEFDYDGFE